MSARSEERSRPEESLASDSAQGGNRPGTAESTASASAYNEREAERILCFDEAAVRFKARIERQARIRQLEKRAEALSKLVMVLLPHAKQRFDLEMKEMEVYADIQRKERQLS